MEAFDTTVNESIDALEKFTKWVDEFCVENSIVEYKDNEEYKCILDMSQEDIMGLSQDECFTNAITLMNYAGLLQKKHDMINGQYVWCVEALNLLYSKYWDNYDKYLPAEVRKKSIVLDNSFAQSIEKCRIRLETGMRILLETAKDIKKRVTLFQDLGKCRSFK